MTTKTKRSYGFLNGAGRVLDLGATFNPPPAPPDDFEAIINDWRVVGNDLRRAIISYGRKSPCRTNRK